MDDEAEAYSGGAQTRPLDEAAEALAADAPDRDAETVRATLSTVAEDGAVSADTVESALAHAAKVVATPETRVELAGIELAEAREAAEPVADLGAVRSRLDAFEARLETIEERVAELGAELRAVDDRPADLADIREAATAIRDLEAAAADAQRAADELTVDIEAFEEWLDDPETRYRELRGDADAVAGTLDGIDATIDALADGDGADWADDSRDVVWLDATLRHRVASLLLADARAELSDLRAMDERAGAGGGAADELAARLDELGARAATVDERLAEVAHPSWRERHGDRLAAFEDALDAFDPPVPWGAVQAVLDEHRPPAAANAAADEA